MIPELRQKPYQVRLRKLGLTTLETRRRRADLTEVYRMFNGLDDIDPKLFFVSQEDCSTRGHRLKILKQIARQDVRKYCFSHRVVNDLNNLPARAIESNTLNEFKGYVDKYLRKYSEDYTSQRVGGSLPRQSSSSGLADLYYILKRRIKVNQGKSEDEKTGSRRSWQILTFLQLHINP